MSKEKSQIDYLKKRIGENIRKIRQQMQIEVKQLCNDLEISPSAYSNIERGVTDISISRVMQLADYFSVHYAQILAVDNTTIFQFSPQSLANSTQHNVNHQATTLNNDGFQLALEQANNEILYLKEQNLKLLDALTKK